MSTYQQVHTLPQTMRRRYLGALLEPQEWFLEEQVRSGEIWVRPGAGYAVFAGDTLVEFYAMDSADAAGDLLDLSRQRPFGQVLGKSYDHALINAARKLGWRLVETGFLFRRRAPVVLKKMANFQLVRARATDLSEVWDVGRDFYVSREEVERLFQSGGLWIATIDGEMVGNGTTIPVDASDTVLDIGMVTRPGQRNKGVASLIVAELADMLEIEGKRPICGCAQSNLASKAALEKAGFVSEHRLVRIDVPE